VLLLAHLIVIVAAVTSVITGFGFNLLVAPLLTFLYPPREIVEITLLLGLLIGGMLLLHTKLREQVDWSLVRSLYFSSLVGMPLGFTFLFWGPRGFLRMLIAALTLAFAILMLARLRFRLERNPYADFAVGASSGFLLGSTSLSGPPVAFYFIALGLPRDAFRANAILFLFATSVTGAAVLFLGRTVSSSDLLLALELLPGLLLGFAGGVRLSSRLSQQHFERVVLLVLMAIGLLGIWGAVS
jgi:uncharacterized membrane protein YfcA